MSFQHRQHKYEPKYEGHNFRTRPGDIQYEPERYEPKKFNYQLDDRYHRPRQEPQGQYQYQEHHRNNYQGPPPHDDRHFHQHQPHQHGGYDDHYGYQHQPEYEHRYGHRHRDDEDRSYDVVPPAGRANKFNARITDLLTSIRDPPHRDDSIAKAMEVNKGYLVLMRFRPSDLADVVTAVQENLSTLAAHTGYAIGFAETSDMKILMSSNQMVASDQWWDPRDRHGKSKYSVCCFWFKDINQARRWFESARNIKQPEFPNYNPYQVIAVPMTYGKNQNPLPMGPDTPEITLLWSEYPNIYQRSENDFYQHYSDPAARCMENYGARPYVAVSKFKPGWSAEPQKFGQPEYLHLNVRNERVARAIRTGWLLKDTFVAVSVFPTMRSVDDFYHDPRYQEIRSGLNRYSDPVFVAIRLRRVQGTNR